MNNVTITAIHDADIRSLLSTEESLIWTGQPCHGMQLLQPVGEERLIHKCLLVGIVLMWCSLFLIDPAKHKDAIWVFGATTIAFMAISYYLADLRRFILSQTLYFITDKRAILVRGGRNWRLRPTLYAVSCYHSSTYPYEIVPDFPYPSLRIGNLLDLTQIQPFGFGISHPGRPILMDRIHPPIMFEYIDNAEELLEMLRFYSRPS